MLRSLSSRLSGNRHSAGLMIGRSHVGFAVCDGAGQRITRIDECRLDVPLFIGQPSDATVTALAEALRELAPEAVGRYLPLHVSVPGAAVQVGVFPLDELPKQRALQRDLARWHFAEAGSGEAALVCECESQGMDGDKHLLLGFAMDQAWHECIVAALAEAGMTAWSLNADVCRQFNCFHDRLCGDKQGGALFAPSADAWSLLLWDDAGRIRYCSSRWRSQDADEPIRIAAEVERRIVACVESLPGLRICHLYAVTSGEDEELAAAVGARLREPCIRLRPEAGRSEFVVGSVASVAAALYS